MIWRCSRGWGRVGWALWLGAALVTVVSLAPGQEPSPGTAGPTSERAPQAVPPTHPEEVTPVIRRSIEEGLAYLARTQNADGTWRSDGGQGSHPTAMTALSGLAFLAAGDTPTQGKHARHVSLALTALLKHAGRDGLIALNEERSHCMHGHGFAMLFFAECYGMEEDAQRQAQIRLALQRAIELTGRSQSAAGGWLYTPDAGGDEGSVTVTQVQGLRAARNAGIAVPKRVIDNAMDYLRRSANPDGGIRYQVSGGGASRPALTPAAVVCWYNAGEYEDPLVEKAHAYIERELLPVQRGAPSHFGHFYYAHLYLAQMKYLDGEEQWKPYYRDIARVLLREQRRDGAWFGDHVGSTYGTSVALIILQLPYKNLPIMQR